MQINDIVNECFIDTGTVVAVISPKFWYPGRPLQEVNVKLLEM